MKKIAKALTLLLTVIVINSCSSDNTGTPTIYGKWYTTEYTQTGTSYIYSEDVCSRNYTEFYGINKYKLSSNSSTACQEMTFVEGTFNLEDDLITVGFINPNTNQPIITKYRILEVTDHSLTIYEDGYWFPNEDGQILPDHVSKFKK